MEGGVTLAWADLLLALPQEVKVNVAKIEMRTRTPDVSG
jgi:hypothetical protein